MASNQIEDATARKEVRQILDQFGHEAADMGGAEPLRAVEPLCILSRNPRVPA